MVARKAREMVSLVQMLVVGVVLEGRRGGVTGGVVEQRAGDVLYALAHALGSRVDGFGQLVEQPPPPTRLLLDRRRLDHGLHEVEEPVSVLGGGDGGQCKPGVFERLPERLHSLDKAVWSETVDDTKVVDFIERLVVLVGGTESSVVGIEP